MKASNLAAVIIMGPPGAGKGTQAELLSEQFGFRHLETSRVLEALFRSARDGEYIEVEGEKYYLADELENWKSGRLCSPPFATKLIEEAIKELFDQGRSIVTSGSPRTVYEGGRLIPVLKNLYGADRVFVVAIEISEEETVHRNSNRRICELMRHPVLYFPETKDLTICPLDGSKLLKREGLDDPDTIKVRLREYAERTVPLFDVYAKEGLSIKKLHGANTPAEVFQSLITLLGLT